MNALVRIGREIPEIEPWVDREMDAWIRRFAFRMTIYVIGAALVLTALGAVFRVGSRALLIATGVAFVGLVLLVTVSRRGTAGAKWSMGWCPRGRRSSTAWPRVGALCCGSRGGFWSRARWGSHWVWAC